MTLPQIPKPYSTVGGLLGEVGTFAAVGYNLRRGDGLYTEAQMLAYRDAVVEACAELLEAQHTWITKEAASALIRSMK